MFPPACCGIGAKPLELNRAVGRSTLLLHAAFPQAIQEGMNRMNPSRQTLPLEVVPLRNGRLPAPRRDWVAIPQAAVAELRLAAIQGDVGAGLTWLQPARLRRVRLDPPPSPYFVCYLSQFAECAPGALVFLRAMLQSFERAALPLDAYAHLRLADGIVALADRDWESAGTHFEVSLSLAAQDVARPELASLAHFWRAILCRRQNKPDLALNHLAEARKGAAPILPAILDCLEGSLHVQKERFGRGRELLRQAEQGLQKPEDWFWRASVRCGFARAAMGVGRYEQALEDWGQAARIYEERLPQHPVLARALMQQASCKRLIALRLSQAVDRHAAQRRKGPPANIERKVESDLATRHRIDELRREASAELARAADLFQALPRQLAAAALTRGWLSLDQGELDHAVARAREAHQAGTRLKDVALMTRARLLESAVEAALCDEGIGEHPASHAHRAHDLAQEALAMAQKADSRKLQAEAYVALGAIHAGDCFGNLEAARECCQRAGEILQSTSRDWLWEAYQMLAARVLRSGSIDAKLKRWSQGLVDNQTFQQITEEFADLVIPAVWLREGKNVSHVVARLSISPKKVRRILNRVGLKPGVESGK